jgi:hypothetical protein
MVLGSIQLLQEVGDTNFLPDKMGGRSARKAKNFSVICEPFL